MSPTKTRARSGFTLIELLLATALFLAAAATVAVFMSQGIRLYSKLTAASQEEAAAVCVAKVSRDLRNMTFYSLIPFKGNKESVSFASLTDLSDPGGEPDPLPVQVVYKYDAEGARMMREETRPQTFEHAAATRLEPVLTGVKELSFEYEGDPNEIPRRVTFHIEYQGRFGLRSIREEVLVPAAPSPSENR